MAHAESGTSDTEAGGAGDPDTTERRRLLLYLDQDMFEALQGWASSEERSLSAQVRYVLAGTIPGQFFS